MTAKSVSGGGQTRAEETDAAYLSNFSTEPTQEPSDEVGGLAVPTLSSAYQKTLLGRFVALPKHVSLGEVASFCSKTNTWLVGWCALVLASSSA